jgi:hypothetical protein
MTVTFPRQPRLLQRDGLSLTSRVMHLCLKIVFIYFFTMPEEEHKCSTMLISTETRVLQVWSRSRDISRKITRWQSCACAKESSTWWHSAMNRTLSSSSERMEGGWLNSPSCISFYSLPAPDLCLRSFYRCQFDPVNGGDMEQLEYRNFMKMEWHESAAPMVYCYRQSQPKSFCF